MKSLEDSADADLQLRVHEEVMAAKQELLIKSMEIGLEIARLNQDERRVAEFERCINADPYTVADRLWVKDQLNPEEEKLRFSK